MWLGCGPGRVHEGSPGSRSSGAEGSWWDGPGRAPTGRGRLRPAGARPVWGCDVLVKDEAAAAGPCCGRGAGRTRGVGHREKPAIGGQD